MTENENLPENESEGKKKINIGREILEWVLSIVIALAIALLLRNYVFTLVKVDGDSMNYTLIDQERLFVIRLGYKPAAGDIIILDPDNGSPAPYIKRVVGMPGQEVTLKTDSAGHVSVYIDGELLKENYISSDLYPGNLGTEAHNGTATYNVPDNCVFAMGDNRPNSHDSRSIGFIPFNHVMGKALFRLWPLSKFGGLYQ